MIETVSLFLQIFGLGFIVYFVCKIFLLWKETQDLKNGVFVDEFVDKVTAKAVIIAEYFTPREKKTDEEFEQKKIETASGIIADVLLQHGVSPKKYNLSALICIARHILFYSRLN